LEVSPCKALAQRGSTIKREEKRKKKTRLNVPRFGSRLSGYPGDRGEGGHRKESLTAVSKLNHEKRNEVVESFLDNKNGYLRQSKKTTN